MKKLVSALLALALMMGMACFAAAGAAGDDVITLPETGVVIEKTEAMKNARGQFSVSELSAIASLPGAQLGIVNYLAMTEKEYAPLLEAVERYTQTAWEKQFSGEAIPEAVTNAAVMAQETMDSKMDNLCFVLALPDEQTWGDPGDVFTQLLGAEEGLFVTRELGKSAGFSHYLISYNPASDYVETTGEWLGEYKEEFKALLEDMDALQANVRLVEPGRVTQGREITFELNDLDGNPVNSSELFAQHAVTMVNIYTTWCGYCYMEMPALEKLSGEYADRDVAIVGICMDAINDDKIAAAKQMLANTGVTYLNLAGNEDLAKALNAKIFPTTLFVGPDGKTLMLPFMGAYVDQYPALLEQALNPGQAAAAETAAPAGEKGTYIVRFTDQNGNSVPEAIIGFCTEAGCVPVDANENGVATYEAERVEYHLTIVELPDGYAEPDGFDMFVGPEDADVTVRVTKE